MSETTVKTAPVKIAKDHYYGATGRRKSAIARVRIAHGKGLVRINDKEIAKPNPTYLKPLELVGLVNRFDLSARVNGGGEVSQSEAIRLGVARALVDYDQSFRLTLKRAGFLTRDPREKERKKPGLKGARRAPQWQKR